MKGYKIRMGRTACPAHLLFTDYLFLALLAYHDKRLLAPRHTRLPLDCFSL